MAAAKHCATCSTGEGQGTGRKKRWSCKKLSVRKYYRTKSLFSKKSKTDLGTKVAPGARSDALGEACGIVVPDGTWNESVEDGNVVR